MMEGSTGQQYLQQSDYVLMPRPHKLRFVSDLKTGSLFSLNSKRDNRSLKNSNLWGDSGVIVIEKVGREEAHIIHLPFVSVPNL